MTAHLQRGARDGAGGAHARPRPARRSRASAPRTGFQMQVELTDGSYDFERLQRVTDEIVARGEPPRPRSSSAFTAFRASVPQVTVKVDKTQAATRNVNVGDVYNTVQIYLGSSFVNLFTRFGHNYMVYLQADPLRRLTPTTSRTSTSATPRGSMVPVGALAEIQAGARHDRGLALQPLSGGDDQRHAGARATARARRSTRWRRSRDGCCRAA